MPIELRPRMIHNVDGTTYDVPYGKGDQCIYSVGRRYINEALLTGKSVQGDSSDRGPVLG